jgi:glycosidase
MRLPKLYIQLFFVSFLCLSAKFAHALEVHPLHWYVGMHNPTLQLMIHAPDTPQPLASYEAVVAHDGVRVTAQHSLDNPNYLWLDLHLAKHLIAQEISIRLTHPEAADVVIEYGLYERRKGSANRAGFSSKDVIYLLTPDRFVNGDSSNDAQPTLLEQPQPDYKGGRHGGDIQGMLDAVDYLAQMGFTQVWTMPLLENNMARYSYHGYSTTDFYQIDPRLGTNALYREYAKQAKLRGVGTIKDIILNHIGSNHTWMQDMPSTDWINHGMTFVPTTHRRETLHDPHATLEDQRAFTDGWFVPTMPDLNQRNPFLATYLIQMAIWWVEYADLSGIRVDTYSYSDKAFLAKWNAAVMDEYPNFTIVGEEWSVNPAITAYWQAGSQRHDDYMSRLPSVMDFPLQTTFVRALLDDETWGTGLVKLHEIIASDFLYGDPYQLVIFPDNHDMGRILSQLNDDPALFKIALTFFATMRGTPQYFYGTEVAMSNRGNDDHGIIRSNFPGGFTGDKANAITGESLSEFALATQRYMRWLLNFRKNSTALTSGRMIQYAPKSGTYTFFRQSESELLMMTINKNDHEVTPNASWFPSMLKDATGVTDVYQQQQFSTDGWQVPPRSMRIFAVQ